MCFTSSDRTDDPPPRPAQIPQQQQLVSSSRPPPSSKASMPQDRYAPPPGPPPSRRPQAGNDDVYNVPPPPGPPPSQRQQQQTEQYLPPEGPPPSYNRPLSNNPYRNSSHRGQSSTDYEPPPGPPPSHAAKPTKQDLQDAFDAAPLEPPPDFFAVWKESPTNNATAEEAEAGKRWCNQNPLYPPYQHRNANTAKIEPLRPPYFRGNLIPDDGGWNVKNKGEGDKCLTMYPPLYSTLAHNPLKSQTPKLIYYEVELSTHNHGEIPLAIGYVAWPYPPFRMPGWNRGSLGVHGDDGSRFVNHDEGGLPFTNPFRPGERLGLGMEFSPAVDHPHMVGGAPVAIDVKVFFTRNGVVAGGWDLHEPKDAKQIGQEGILGLEGQHDVYAAVGFWEKVELKLIFAPEKWLWQGWKTQRGY